MPTGLLPEPFVSWRIVCLEGNAAIPQRLPLPRARNFRGGHRAVDVDAIPGLARTVRASQENRSLDTPSLFLRLCYRRGRLLDAVPPVRTGCRALGYVPQDRSCGRAVHFLDRQVPALGPTGAPRYSPLAVLYQCSRRHYRGERREKVCPAGLV